MGGFFRSKKFRIILCIVALLIGMMLYAVTRDGYTLPTTGFPVPPHADAAPRFPSGIPWIW